MPVLKQGSQGEEVKSLQQSLKQLGFKLGVDGDFGEKTTKALKAFQKSVGLEVDGRAGTDTLKAIHAAVKDLTPSPPKSGNSQAAPLTDADFAYAAKILNCDIAAIKAVAEVESAGNGFLSDGRVKILFEGHQFYKHTRGAYATDYPTLCYKKWTKVYYTKGKTADIRGAGELARLEAAIALDRTAALKSASYGKFQIMGFNYDHCGFTDVEDFYQAMQTSEGEQLKAFCGFIKYNQLDGHLRNHRWANFARGYNGAKYAENEYDKKLGAAHAKYSKK
jgi:N-acetylmuramidase/Putative peptidoglycan binding domain